MQRRDFLRLAAGATGTAVLGGMLGSRSAKAAAVKTPEAELAIRHCRSGFRGGKAGVT
jgi:phospholipase C